MIKNNKISKTEKGSFALILTKNGDVLLQQRDINPNIENSGKISMFGGALNDNEKLLCGLKRELLEELELNINKYKIEKLNVYQKSKELDGIDLSVNVWLIYGVDKDTLILHEGNSMVLSKPRDIVDNIKLSRVTKLALQDLINKK